MSEINAVPQTEERKRISADEIQMALSAKLDEIQAEGDFTIADVMGALSVMRVRAETSMAMMHQRNLMAAEQHQAALLAEQRAAAEPSVQVQ
jgi:hypothetical protein